MIIDLAVARFIAFCSYVFSFVILLSYFSPYLFLISHLVAGILCQQITSVNRVIAPALITAYTAVILFILLNVLISILMDSFALARETIKGQPNDFELLDCMVNSLKITMVTPLHLWDLTCRSDLGMSAGDFQK